MTLAELDVTTVKLVALITLGVLVLLFLAVLLLIRKVLAKLFVLAVIAVLAVAVYSQRADLEQCPKTCSCSFFGHQLTIDNQTLARACQDAVS